MLDVTITAANYGETGLVTETLPAGFTYVSSTPPGLGAVAEDGQTVSFVLLENPFTYTVTASDMAGTYSFSGVLRDFEKTDVDVGGATDVTVEAVAGPRAARSFSKSSVTPGGRFTVEVTANDYGRSGLVHETLPEGFTYVSSSPDGIAEVNEANGQMVSFVLLGANKLFTYTVDAPDSVGDYTFDGELVDFEKDTYPVGGASSIKVAVAPPTALRSISESAVVEGDQLDVTVIALNYGLAGTLVESLPAGLEYVSSNMADALIVRGQTLTYTLVGNNLSVTYTVEATQTGTHTISGYLQSFDRTIAPVQGGANSVTVSSATQPPTSGGTYVGPDPTSDACADRDACAANGYSSAANRDSSAADRDSSAADRDIRAADRDIRAANRDIRAANRDIRAAGNGDIRAADRDIRAAGNGYVSAANRDSSAVRADRDSSAARADRDSSAARADRDSSAARADRAACADSNDAARADRDNAACADSDNAACADSDISAATCADSDISAADSGARADASADSDAATG